jgi:TIGR03009 family protein
LAGLLLIVGAAVSQQPQQQPPAAAPTHDPQNNRLDAILLQWEAKMKEVEGLRAQVVHQTEDKAFRTRTVFEGTALYKKPNLASLDLRRKDRPAVIEKFVCTGRNLYVFDQDSKEIRVYELTPKAGQVSDDNFLSFLFEIKAVEAKKRYDLSLFKDPDKPQTASDSYYFFLKILPRFPADKAEFQVAHLAISRSTFLPRTLILDDPKGNRTQWDIPVIESGAKLDPREFMQPNLPPGWQYRRMPNVSEARPQRAEDLPPRIVRPKP